MKYWGFGHRCYTGTADAGAHHRCNSDQWDKRVTLLQLVQPAQPAHIHVCVQAVPVAAM